jgi:hypothetical protein
MNAELVAQINANYIPISVLLIAASAFLICFAGAGVAAIRMIQLYIATNISIARELAIIKNSMTVPVQPGTAGASFPMPSSAATAGKRSVDSVIPPFPSGEGEILSYDESEMADQEAIRVLRAQRKAEGGMDDEEWQREIERIQAAGFKAETV